MHLMILAMLCFQEWAITDHPGFVITETVTVQQPAPLQIVKTPRRYLAMFTGSYCGPCQVWKRTHKHRVERAGFTVIEYEMTDERNQRKFGDAGRGNHQITSLPTFVVVDYETGDWLSAPIVGSTSADTLIPLLNQGSGQVVIPQTPKPQPVQPVVQETPGRYTTYGGRTYDWENETYYKCGLGNRCGMCVYLYNACWSYRNARGLTKAEKPSPLSSSAEFMDEALATLPLKPESVLWDAGSGDGCVLIRAVELYGCSGVGVEIDQAKVDESRRMILAHGLSHKIKIYKGDVRDFDLKLHGVTHIYAYLYEDLLKEIADKLTSVEASVCPGHEVPGIGQKLVGSCWVWKKDKENEESVSRVDAGHRPVLVGIR